jgi:hypothetical protein
VAEGIVTESDREFRQIILGRSPEVQRLALAARDLITELLPGVVEVVWITQGNAGYGTGPRKMSEQFAWILPASKHVAIAFPRGTSLPDPTGLLQGTGASIRNVRLTTLDDIRSPAVHELLESSIAELRSR